MFFQKAAKTAIPFKSRLSDHQIAPVSHVEQIYKINNCSDVELTLNSNSWIEI